MKTIIIFQILTAVIGTYFCGYFCGLEAAKAFLYGNLMMLANVMAMAFAWGNIFNKKNIALSTLIIVIKYAILGTILIYLVKVLRVDLLWFALGISSLILAAVAYALREAFKEVKDGI